MKKKSEDKGNMVGLARGQDAPRQAATPPSMPVAPPGVHKAPMTNLPPIKQYGLTSDAKPVTSASQVPMNSSTGTSPFMDVSSSMKGAIPDGGVNKPGFPFENANKPLQSNPPVTGGGSMGIERAMPGLYRPPTPGVYKSGSLLGAQLGKIAGSYCTKTMKKKKKK